MEKDNTVYLHHILDAINTIEARTAVEGPIESICFNESIAFLQPFGLDTGRTNTVLLDQRFSPAPSGAYVELSSK